MGTGPAHAGQPGRQQACRLTSGPLPARYHRNEELRAVGVGARVGCTRGVLDNGRATSPRTRRRTHGKQALLGVLERKVLVGKLHAVDGFAAHARPVRKVATLQQ
jgi:hypothetical protein